MENENNPQAKAYLECSKCRTSLSKEARARWNCGLIPPRNRVGPGFPTFSDPNDSKAICPGYLISLDPVIECARARLHWKNGLLRERYEDEPLTGILLDGIELLDSSICEVESEAMSEGR